MPPDSGAEILRVKLVPPAGIPTESATVSDREPLAGAGSEIVASFRVIPFLPLRGEWVATILDFEWNHHFSDMQKKGPFKSFHHRHEFSSETRGGQSGTIVRDIIDYEVGFGFLGEIAEKIFVHPKFQRMFAYRQQALGRLLGLRNSTDAEFF